MLNLTVISASAISQSPYMQLAGVIHIHTTFSSGQDSLEEIASHARELGLDVLIPTDHDLVVMEYGLPPFRNILKVRKSRDAILDVGPSVYLDAIAAVNRSHPDIITIPGFQSSPYYYWSGNPITGSLTAHDYRKEILVVGMKDASAYKALPLLHNGWSWRYFFNYLPGTLIFLAALGISIYLYRQQKIFRWIGLGLGGVSLLLLVNHHPFQSSLFNPYQGDQGIAPWQQLIDYVESNGGMAFWAHPESRYAIGGKKIGPVTFTTPPYPEAIIGSSGYTGFSALYGDTIKLTDSGRQWDSLLQSYCRGQRDKPAWGIAGADFHGLGTGDPLGTFQTIFLVTEKTSAAVLNALRLGRCYAVRKKGDARLAINHFYLKDKQTGETAIMGEHLCTTTIPVVEGTIAATDDNEHPVRITLISDGHTVFTQRGSTPLNFSFHPDTLAAPSTYMRLEATSERIGKLLSNPIFVTQKKGSTA